MSSKQTMRSPAGLKRVLTILILVACWSLIIQTFSFRHLWTPPNNQDSQQLMNTIQTQAIAEAYSYAQSFSNIDRRLLFVHIPKTAGSTMETEVALGQDRNLTWGRCMFLDGTMGCSSVKDEKLRFVPSANPPPPYWHIPVHYFPLHDYNPYHADTFAIIRHPVDRAVSEYHYICTRGWLRSKGRLNQCKNMTNFILDAMNPMKAKNFYFPRDGYHWISQYDLIVGPFETRTVDHILQMEDMSPHFERMATAYGLPHLHWPVHRINSAPSSNSTKLAELPGNLSTTICKYPYVIDDLALWNNSASGRDLFPKAKYGHMCKG
jgi:hypothetical protein